MVSTEFDAMRTRCEVMPDWEKCLSKDMQGTFAAGMESQGLDKKM